MVDSSRDRDLGFLEHFRSALHDLQYHFNISMAGLFSISGDQEYTAYQLVTFGLQHAVAIHPGLSVNIAPNSTGRPHFRRLSKIPLHRLVSFERVPSSSFDDPQFLDQIASRENSRGFLDDELPLWRAVVLQPDTDGLNSDFWLFISWHHSIGDGISGLAVYNDIVRGMEIFDANFNSVEKPRIPDQGQPILLDASKKPLLPPLEDIISLPVSPSKAPPTAPPKKKWGGASIFCKAPVVTKVHVLKISNEVLVRVLALCRVHSTTLTALLQATVGSVILHLTKGELAMSATAMSLRRFFPPSTGIDDSCMGMWVGSIFADYEEDILGRDDSQERLWQRAAQDHAQIKKEIAKRGQNLDISQWKDVVEFDTAMKSLLGHPREKSFAITNLNTFRPSEQARSARWKIEDMFFSQSCHVQGSAVQACIMSLQDKCLSIAFTWQDGVVEDHLVEDMAHMVGRLLEEMK